MPNSIFRVFFPIVVYYVCIWNRFEYLSSSSELVTTDNQGSQVQKRRPMRVGMHARGMLVLQVQNSRFLRCSLQSVFCMLSVCGVRNKFQNSSCSIMCAQTDFHDFRISGWRGIRYRFSCTVPVVVPTVRISETMTDCLSVCTSVPYVPYVRTGSMTDSSLRVLLLTN
jgi:hypothetical protein